MIAMKANNPNQVLETAKAFLAGDTVEFIKNPSESTSFDRSSVTAWLLQAWAAPTAEQAEEAIFHAMELEPENPLVNLGSEWFGALSVHCQELMSAPSEQAEAPQAEVVAEDHEVIYVPDVSGDSTASAGLVGGAGAAVAAGTLGLGSDRSEEEAETRRREEEEAEARRRDEEAEARRREEEAEARRREEEAEARRREEEAEAQRREEEEAEARRREEEETEARRREEEESETRRREEEAAAEADSAEVVEASICSDVSELSDDVQAVVAAGGTPAVSADQDEAARKPLVMAVDDSPTIRKLVSITLSREGFEVITASDGLEALQLLADHRPDIILSDVNMPRLDGYKLCRYIKKNKGFKDIPVVMLSGKDGPFDKLRGRMFGCGDYITKPFEASDLVEKVRQHTGVLEKA